MTTAERLDTLERDVEQLKINEARIIELTETLLAGQQRLEEGQRELNIYIKAVAGRLLSPAEIAEIDRCVKESG